MGYGSRIDWKSERDRVDLVAVATDLLGEAPGRDGERGRRLWWSCPFHEDRNPSFCIEPGQAWWKCHGCGERGDAANLLMRLGRIGFPEAVARLVGGSPGPTVTIAGPRPRPARPPEAPSSLPAADAAALVDSAEARLWSTEGSDALARLLRDRRLTPDTVRAARIGWTPGVEIPTRTGGTYTARGLVIPWFDGDRLALVKVRQPDGGRPKYAEAFRDRPGIYPGGNEFEPGLPLIVVEGEFDALLLGQELRGLAVVVTIGSASIKLTPAQRVPLHALWPWFIATDADDAGDRAAQAWPAARSTRVRPPSPFKDWTDAAQGWPGRGGVDLRRWWSERIALAESPRLFTRDDLSTWRWGPAAGEPEPAAGPVEVDDPEAWPPGRE